MKQINIEDLNSLDALAQFDTFGSLHLNPSTQGSRYLLINWNVGNTCTYKCSYCAVDCHNGSFGWPEVEQALNIVEKIDSVYKTDPYLKESVVFELLGGEVTLWPAIEKVARRIKELGNTTRLVTNGVRKPSWWAKNGPLFDGGITLSFHPEFADYKHVTEVSNALADVGVAPALLVLMYPEKWDYCIEAYEYFKQNADFFCLTPQKLTLIKDSREGAKIHEQDSELTDWPYSEEQLTWLKKNFGIFRPNPELTSYGLMGYYKSQETNDRVISHSPYVYSHGLNSWKNWDCYVGIDTLYLEQNGDIRRDVMCRSTPVLGNWKSTAEELDKVLWPTNPVKCPYNSCYCAHDFLARKVRRQESHLGN